MVTIDSKTFGKFEPGNKVYYPELDEYFSSNEKLRERGSTFTSLLVPSFRVEPFQIGKSSYYFES